MQSSHQQRQPVTQRRKFTIKPVAVACGVLMMASSGAYAQQAAPAVKADAATANNLGTMVVTGIRKSLEDSVALKLNSDSIIEAVSAEDLGKLPDASIAEALSRLPGVTGQRGPDGRVNVISIRGLSPEFSGSLLNGREVVSSSDSRAVEYDQFPSELIGSAVVYKTPDGTLIGQGLSGTVDLRARRPLDTRGREIAVNVRGETNSNGDLVPGVANKMGTRLSASYVDQFADNTFGVALGFARLNSPTQVKRTELDSVEDFVSFGLPFSGVPKSQLPSANNASPYALVPMVWKATSATKSNERDGLMGVFEFKPNADLHSTVDLYYSKFKTHEVLGQMTTFMWNAWGFAPTPAMTSSQVTQVGKNSYVTGATVDNMPVTSNSSDYTREDSITALGWNTEFRINEAWKGIVDLSLSRDVRNEKRSEAYAAPYDFANKSSFTGSWTWNVPVNGDQQTWTPAKSNILSDAPNMAFGDSAAVNFVPGNPLWAGSIRSPESLDDIKSLRLSAKRELSGIFSGFTGGANYTERNKSVAANEERILMKRDANGNIIRNIPASVVGTPFDMSWAGIPSLLNVDVPALVASGNVTLEQGQFGNKVDNDSSIQEKITTVFGKLDIDTNVLGIPLRGNLGLQVIQANQTSQGWEYRGDGDHPDISLLFKRTGGTSYTDYLPSLNLVANVQRDLIVRFGLAKVLARPSIVDMRAGTSTPSLSNAQAGTPTAGEWGMAYAGNPEIEPWRATAIDVSFEKYFGKRSYISAALFRKNLQNYIFNEVSVRDNSFLPTPVTTPVGVTPLTYGPVTKPTNGHGGSLDGIELSASLEGGLLHPMLDGFGVIASASKLSSDLKDAKGEQVMLNGLSGTSASMTVYYENQGFSARVSERYRAPFTATSRDIYFKSVTLQQEADRVVDLQFGYAFEQGAYKGLSLLFQINNVLDQTTMNSKSSGPASQDNTPDPTQLVPNYTYKFGRQTLVGLNYKF